MLAGLATCNPKFPIAEWDRLIPQANITLNLLCNSRVNPKLSTYAYVFGNFDFNATPLTPPGTKVIVHKKSTHHDSWAYQGVEGWTIGPSLEHYRCVKCYTSDTVAEVDADTVKLIPHRMPMPSFNDEDAIKQAMSDITHILKQPEKNNIPTDMKGDSTVQAFQHITTVLNKNTVSVSKGPVLTTVPAAVPVPSPLSPQH
eukprot:1903466-Ditylum_brightwellii.AAC.1